VSGYFENVPWMSGDPCPFDVPQDTLKRALFDSFPFGDRILIASQPSKVDRAWPFNVQVALKDCVPASVKLRLASPVLVPSLRTKL
jgi:hypothetical protein